uniref:Uncharacterized protein n=1 Tax=Phaeomonas parva TaxID=124430 RepID=A0A6U4L8E9_9STRA|mmetsp:Transcript_9277/g.27251  ORF Transcript_9277/g.27251 Transcript_9277/m.27251 type:complete len:495 (+) Transcript_9277:769-2253(+)
MFVLDDGGLGKRPIRERYFTGLALAAAFVVLATLSVSLPSSGFATPAAEQLAVDDVDLRANASICAVDEVNRLLPAPRAACWSHHVAVDDVLTQFVGLQMRPQLRDADGDADLDLELYVRWAGQTRDSGKWETVAKGNVARSTRCSAGGACEEFWVGALLTADYDEHFIMVQLLDGSADIATADVSIRFTRRDFEGMVLTLKTLLLLAATAVLACHLHVTVGQREEELPGGAGPFADRTMWLLVIVLVAAANPLYGLRYVDVEWLVPDFLGQAAALGAFAYVWAAFAARLAPGMPQSLNVAIGAAAAVAVISYIAAELDWLVVLTTDPLFDWGEGAVRFRAVSGLLVAALMLYLILLTIQAARAWGESVRGSDWRIRFVSALHLGAALGLGLVALAAAFRRINPMGETVRIAMPMLQGSGAITALWLAGSTAYVALLSFLQHGERRSHIAGFVDLDEEGDFDEPDTPIEFEVVNGELELVDVDVQPKPNPEAWA